LKAQDFDVFSDSLFYKKFIFKGDESGLIKNNLFFYDELRYDNSSLSFLSYQVAPTKNIVDLFFLKNKSRVYTVKPFFMNFKLFSENQFDGFEKFYLKDKLYVADSYEYSVINDENFDFYLSEEQSVKDARFEEFRHFFRVRIPYEGEENEKTRQAINERAEGELHKPFLNDKGLRSMFSPGAGFYRESEKNYKGYGSFKYKGRVLDPGIIYNFSNFRDYD